MASRSGSRASIRLRAPTCTRPRAALIWISGVKRIRRTCPPLPCIRDCDLHRTSRSKRRSTSSATRPIRSRRVDLRETRNARPSNCRTPLRPNSSCSLDEEIEFLKSSDARRFTLAVPDETVQRRSRRTFARGSQKRGSIRCRRSSRPARYVEGRDLPNIPLNTSSPTFNAWNAIRPRSMDPAREPGAVRLTRGGGFRSNGPPTFGGFPLALTRGRSRCCRSRCGNRRRPAQYGLSMA